MDSPIVQTARNRQMFDEKTERHFQRWLDKNIYDDERDAIESKIRRLIREHPEYLTKNWQEMRRVAESSYR